jgi:hypothetical protein
MHPEHKILELPQRSDGRGHLVFGQDGDHLPFVVKRFFLLYELAPGATRGGHAHRAQHQLLIMTAGGATVIVDNGVTRTAVRLDKPSQALHVPPGLWLELEAFTPGAACLVLASDLYTEADYIRDRAEYLRLTGSPA